MEHLHSFRGKKIFILKNIGQSGSFTMTFNPTNCCFLNCTQVSQEAGKVVWYSHLFKNFPQFAVIHTIKGFSIINEAEFNVFSGILCFLYDPPDIGNLISGSSAFSKSSLYIWKFSVHVLLKPDATQIN